MNTSSRLLAGLVATVAAVVGVAASPTLSGTSVDAPSPRTAVTRMDTALVRALDRATVAAADDGVTISVTSGWRSPAHQQRLLADAVATYGSQEEAARWVATPETSPHVQGDAVDIGPYDAMDWLSRHGAEHGLCRIYDNEPWHFELRPGARRHGCPATYPDPTHDPRMQHTP